MIDPNNDECAGHRRLPCPPTRQKLYGIIGALVAGGLLVILFWPTLLWLSRQWSSNDYYAHGPLVPLVSAFLMWRRWGAPHPTRNATYIGLAVLFGGIGANIWAVSARAPYLSAICLIVVLSGLILFLRGADALYRLAFPLAFLIAAIPFPFVERASVPLQVVTAYWSTKLASLLGLEVIQAGSQLSLEGCSLVVGAPCSGLRSLVTFTSLVALLLYITRGTWFAKVALLALALPVALLVNVLRVTSLLAVAHLWGEEVALQYYHSFFGIVFYAISLSLLFLLVRVLKCHEIRSDI